MFKTTEEVVSAIQEAQGRLNAEFAKTTKVSQQKARKITLELAGLYKQYRQISVK